MQKIYDTSEIVIQTVLKYKQLPKEIFITEKWIYCENIIEITII